MLQEIFDILVLKEIKTSLNNISLVRVALCLLSVVSFLILTLNAIESERSENNVANLVRETIQFALWHDVMTIESIDGQLWTNISRLFFVIVYDVEESDRINITNKRACWNFLMSESFPPQ